MRKKKSNIKQYYKDNALILILEFSIPFVLSLIFYYFSGEYKIDLLMSLVFWSVTLIPHHLNNILGSFPVWKGKFEVDEEILFTYSVYIKSMTIFKYNLIITNKNLILKSIYGENKYNIIFPLEKILRIEIEKNKLVLKFKFYTEIKLRADNPELIKEEFDKIKSDLLENKEEKNKELA